MMGHVAYKILLENSDGKRTLGRPRHRWLDVNKMDSKLHGIRMWVALKLLRIIFSDGLWTTRY
jgi:hypothetical protein